MTEKVLRRARQSSEKFERRCQILAAAEALFTERGGELPSAQAVADRAGLAKGTVYLYFATIEDVFIALLSEHTVRWLTEAQEKLRRARPPLTPDKVAAAMSVYPVEQPVVMRLASASTFQIERPGTEEAYLALRQQFANTLTQFGRFLEESLPGLARGKGATAALKALAVTFGLWQVSNPIHAELRPTTLRLDFARELPHMLRSHWRGEVS